MPPMTTVSFLQITDRVMGKSAKSNLLLEEYRRFFEVVASDVSGEVGVICLKDVEIEFKNGRAVPSNVKLAHYGNITGSNAFSEMSDLILIGRPEPAPYDVEKKARLFFKRPVIELPAGTYYPKMPRGMAIRDRDEAVGVLGSLHPDEGVEAFRWSACEGELLQAIYRARPLNRTGRNPLTIHIATNVCLPIEIDFAMTWDEMQPILPEVMLARGGMWLTSYPDMAAAYPDLFSSENAAKAKMAADREGWKKRGVDSYKVFLIGIDTPFGPQVFLAKPAGSYRESTPFKLICYRRAGSRGLPAWGLYDPKRIPDPAEWLRERLECEVVMLPTERGNEP
jgi:putative DNA primase/helicase